MTSVEEPMSDVDLNADPRLTRVEDPEKYHHLTVHQLSPERELSHHHHPHPDAPLTVVREYPVDVGTPEPAPVSIAGGQQQQHPHPQHQHQHPHVVPADAKKQKKPLFGGFGRRHNHPNPHVGAEGHDVHQHPHPPHSHDAGYEKNGGHHHHQDPHLTEDPSGHGRPVTLTVYPAYLYRLTGILRIVQLVVGIIVCGTVNAEQCFTAAGEFITCSSPSGPYWYGQLGGQGYVLFVAILFILGNFALIFYRICTRQGAVVRKERPAGLTALKTNDKSRLGELVYDVAAVLLYIIAASVESWYASWTHFDVMSRVMVGNVISREPNVYRSQWIAAAVFAWLNVILYAISLPATMMLR